MVKKMDTINILSAIIDFESGTLSEEETVELFQALVDQNLAFEMQGSYGRMAMDLYSAGLISINGKYADKLE
jgi:hypothetical protein